MPATAIERFYVIIPLTEAALSAPVEVIYVGVFHLADRGKVLELTEAQIDEMVENFHRLGEAERIPINVNHHSHAGTLEEARAVGWVTDLQKVATREGERLSLMATPTWLEDAAEAIAAGQFKFLSAEIVFNDTDYRNAQPIGCHLKGVALTNTPAIPDLTPITLTQAGSAESTQLKIETALGRLHLNDSLMERVRSIITAFYASFWDTETLMRCVEDVREEDLIVCEMAETGETLWSVPYSEDAAGVILFAPRERWAEMEQVYQPKSGANTPPLTQPVGEGALPMVAANGSEKEATAASSSLSSAADCGTIPLSEEQKAMDELLKLLGLGADGDCLATVRGLLEKVTNLTRERDEIQTQLTQAQAQTTQLTAKSAEVATLTTQVSAYEAEMQRLAGEVTKLTEAQKGRDTSDRIALALRQGRTTPAELDAQEMFLRNLAGEQPETFNKVMALRPERPELFMETGGNGEPAPVTPTDADKALDAMIAECNRVAAEKKVDFDTARTQVLSEHPEWAALTTQEEGK